MEREIEEERIEGERQLLLLRAQTLKDHFVSVKIGVKIEEIATSVIKHHNAIKGTNLCVVYVLKARAKRDVVGVLYHLTLQVEEEKSDSPTRKRKMKMKTIIEKMVWAGKSQESISFFTPRSNYSLHSDIDYQFDFNFQEPPPPRPNRCKIQRLAQFALDTLNDDILGDYGLELENSKDVEITLGKWGSRTYSKGTTGYSVFDVFSFDLKVLAETPDDVPIPNNLMVVNKLWLQTLDDEKAHSFLYNLSRPRHHPVIERTSTYRPLLEVSLKSPRVETAAWFALEDELFKRNKQLEFVQVVGGSVGSCAGRVFDLTIEARDQGVLKMFETRVSERQWLDCWETDPFQPCTTTSETLVSSVRPSCQC